MKYLMILLVSVVLLSSCSGLSNVTQNNSDNWHLSANTVLSTETPGCYISIASGRSSDLMTAMKIAIHKATWLVRDELGVKELRTTSEIIDEVSFQESNGQFIHYVKMKIYLLDK